MEAKATVTTNPALPVIDGDDTGAKVFPPGTRHKRLGLVLKERYRIVALIASGGTSDVYKATDLYLEKAGTKDSLVAVKILRSELTRDAGALALLARETAKSKRLSHPNIIRVHDLDHDGDTWFMVMELLEGEPLSRVIQRAKPKGLRWEGGRAVLEQITSALAFSHSQGVVHADLKPSNIFFTRDGDVKLLDFGVAHALAPHQPLDFLNPRHEDETTIYGYTPAYASPSLVAGRDPTVRDDLYALACIAYELLSSRHPFDRQKLDQKELATYPLGKPENMPPRLWQTVRKLLRFESDEVDLPGFQAALQPLQWKARFYPVALAGALVAAALIGQQGYARLQTAETRLLAHSEHALFLEQLTQQQPARILAELESLSALERAGVLQLEQERILDHYSKLVEDALQAEGRPNLPNIPAALAVLGDARQLYPNNGSLAHQHGQLQNRSESLQAGLLEEIGARLNQGAYGDFQTLDELRDLTADFRFLNTGALSPSARSVEVFNSKLETALKNDDGPGLARLLEVGALFFDATPASETLLTEARELETAIELLGQYHAELAAGGSPVYPEEAAEQFYARRFSDWQDRITGAENSRALDSVYTEMTVQKQAIPSRYKPFADLKQRLADAYVEQASILLDRNRTQQAQPLLHKATTLMR